MGKKIKSLKHWRHLVLAAVLLVVGLFFQFALAGYRALAAGFFGLTAIVLIYYGIQRLTAVRPRAGKILNRVVSYGLVLFLLAFGTTEGAIIGDARSELPEDLELDYIIVLGAGVNGTTPSRVLTWRLEAALEYLEAYPDAMCIVSGGQGPGEDITEGLCMEMWLKARGIPEERILREEASTSTAENLAFSQEIIQEREGDASVTVGIVTSEFHIMRAKLLASRAGLTAYGLPADTKLPVLKVNYFFREVFALWKTMVLD